MLIDHILLNLLFCRAVRALCQCTGDGHLILLITLCDTLRAVLKADIRDIHKSYGSAGRCRKNDSLKLIDRIVLIIRILNLYIDIISVNIQGRCRRSADHHVYLGSNGGRGKSLRCRLDRIHIDLYKGSAVFKGRVDVCRIRALLKLGNDLIRCFL